MRERNDEEVLHLTRRFLAKDFFASNLSGASFRNMNLEGVDFSRCNLQNVDFSVASLHGATFADADLSGARFAGAKGMEFALSASDLSTEAIKPLSASARLWNRQIEEAVDRWRTEHERQSEQSQPNRFGEDQAIGYGAANCFARSERLRRFVFTRGRNAFDDSLNEFKAEALTVWVKRGRPPTWRDRFGFFGKAVGLIFTSIWAAVMDRFGRSASRQTPRS